MSKPFTVREDDQSDKAKMIRAAFEAAFSESENMVKSTDNIPKNIGYSENRVESLKLKNHL